jgi:hypothetical protein
MDFLKFSQSFEGKKYLFESLVTTGKKHGQRPENTPLEDLNGVVVRYADC